MCSTGNCNLHEELVDAAIHYDVPRMEALLAKGADFNAVDPEEGETAFTQAIYNGVSHDCVWDMLRLGAKADVPSSIGGTPLYYAVDALDFRLVKMLLEAGANPNTPGFIEEDGATPLDSVADGYHCDEDPAAHLVLDGLEMLLKSRGAKFYYEIRGK